MAVINAIPEKVEIPHEPGQWFELRRLSWSQLRDARKKQNDTNREEVKALGADFIKAMQSGSKTDADRLEKEMESRAEAASWKVAAFDMETVLRTGITSWSYVEELKPEAILGLDEATAKWAASTIIERSKPLAGDAAKNVSVASTAS